MKLETKQKKLGLTLINYDLTKEWNSHKLISELRERIVPFFPEGLYDPQDLEHQVLFRLTTFDPSEITDETLKKVIEEQYSIIQDRLSKLDYDLPHLFRGLTNKHKDLNCNNRLTLCRENGKIFAKNGHTSFEVEFKVVHDENLISLFTSELHYVHAKRAKGETFGLFFVGDEIPFCVETTEPAIFSKDYKMDCLIAHGIDPNKTIELTRFYTLPGSPTNAISIMDSLVAKYYKERGIEAMFTTTMPMYSKTKSTTIAGGMNKVLLVKDLSHKFAGMIIHEKKVYRQVTNDYIKHNNVADCISTHPNFPTMLTVEVYMLLNETALESLNIPEGKAIYINRKKKMEKEVKFKVKDITTLVNLLGQRAKNVSTFYLRDVIYGDSSKRKIRLRIYNDFRKARFEVNCKSNTCLKEDVVTSVEEILYGGFDYEEAMKSILLQGDFKEENSYEKIRTVYYGDNVEICLDIYPFGAIMEIEGEPNAIWETASELGFKKDDAITLTADEVYLDWIKKNNLPEQWDVRFGLDRK